MKQNRLIAPSESLARDLAAYAQSKGRDYQEMAEQALRLGLRMLQMQSDQPVTVVRRRENEHARQM